MKLLRPQPIGILLALGFIQHIGPSVSQSQTISQSRLIDKCCQLGKERAIRFSRSNCKLRANEALASNRQSHDPLTLAIESMLVRVPSFADQCETTLESCCLGHHQTRICDSGDQYGDTDADCTDAEFSEDKIQTASDTTRRNINVNILSNIPFVDIIRAYRGLPPDAHQAIASEPNPTKSGKRSKFS